MKTLPLSSALLFAFALSAHATSFPVKNGKMGINLNGGTGGNAGSVNLNLAYTDATKTAVSITGDGKYNGKAFTVNETATLAALKEIDIYAAGGNGYDGDNGSSGYSGNNGSDGWNGQDGSSGCPPSSGSNGTNGSDGTSGGNGGDGGDAGNGGNGGQVRVTTAADSSELLLLVKSTVAAGSGGSGGSGGAGGSGGRGGRGGSAGRGGQNTCTDDKGNFVGGPSGSDGWAGSDGRNGSDGYAGRNGSDGRDGRSGNMVYVNTDASGTHEYAHAFKLTINSVKAIDDNEDGVVEPGEGISITEIVISNSGPMPTPAGQALNLTFAANSTLAIKAAAAVPITDVIPGNTTKTLTFAKGVLTFTVPDDAKLVGKDTLLSTNLGINTFSIQSADKTGLSIHWPVGLIAGSNNSSFYFGAQKVLNYTIKNVTSKDVGPSGQQPIDVTFEWVSKDVPGADVLVVLKDGRQFALDRPYVVNDFTVPAKGTLAVPVTISVKNSKTALTASGSLKVTLKLNDESGKGEDAVDSSAAALSLVADFRPVAISRRIDLTNARIQCKFPHRLLQTLDISELDLTKKAGSDSVTMQISRKGFLSDGTSPAHTVNTFDFGPYGSLAKTASPAVVVSFLNHIFAPASAKDESTWIMQPGACAIKAQ
ncbi:MAG: DUF7932 domain-containing protein [Bdellovibrionota bacterium]